MAAGFVVTTMVALAARTAVELLVCLRRNHRDPQHVEIINFIIVFTTIIIKSVIIATYIFSKGKCKCCRRRPSCQRCVPAVIVFLFLYSFVYSIFPYHSFLYSFAHSIPYFFFFCDLIFLQWLAPSTYFLFSAILYFFCHSLAFRGSDIAFCLGAAHILARAQGAWRPKK